MNIIMCILMNSNIPKMTVVIGILVTAMSAPFVDLQLKNLQSLKRIVLTTKNRKQNMIKNLQYGIMLIRIMDIHMNQQMLSGVKTLHL